MYPSSLFQALLLSSALVPNTFAQNITDPTKRAELSLTALQIWYNAGTGLWNGAGWWNSANAMTVVSNLAKIDSSKTVQDLASRIFSNTIVQAPAKNPQPGVEGTSAKRDDSIIIGSGYNKSIGADDQYITTFPLEWGMNGEYVDVKSLPIYNPKQAAVAASANPSDWLDGFYDDDLWWALGWIGAYDVTKDTKYLNLASGIFKAVTKAWPTNCGNGGIWWSWQKNYANAIANELFLSTAAHLANRVNASDKAYYVDWAQKEINWFLSTGMINERGTINDGLNSNCKNNNMTAWSYNQGVILSGLVELNKAAPNSTYLTIASKIAKAAITELSDSNNVLHDKCGPLCGGDASQFKGIFSRGLQALQEVAPDDVFNKSIQANANSIWNNNRDEGNMLSINWAGPFIAPPNATTHSSAMDALVAAITA
ncbi:Six-hairpin glycosidase [Massarina eburnea CBS 473.64]|uniref:Six-hairpin glycosidase n=1 Tax=Massarina eburnea CBS 473.64 TaxID=1395130 RepID=A0A6A6S7P5_9PLEO|nr:Six-hairpin glycosidase [Massarina eburnea CBS 473.64]